jgi:choline dehydrogenase-like flavoprotein
MWCVRPSLGEPATLRIARPERVDFEAQEAYDIPAWPVPWREIDGYLDDACEFFGLPGVSFEPPRGTTGCYRFDSDIFEARYFHFPEASVIYENRLAEVRKFENLDLRTGLTLIDVETDSTRSKVTKLTFVDASEERLTTTPKQVVLAAGGIESARILLNAVEEGQIVDPHDTLGRWFMDHPHARLGLLIPDGDIREAGAFHDFHDQDGRIVLGHYALAEAAVRAEKLLRFSMTLVGAPSVSASNAAAAGARLVNSWGEGLTPIDVAKEFVALAKEPRATIEQLRHKLSRGPRHHTALGGWSRPETEVTEVGVLNIESMVGQRPSRDNRIRLGRARGYDGKRQAELQWSWSRPEVDSYWRSVHLAQKHFDQIGMGKFIGAAELGSGEVPRAGTGWHQMGGTRMSAEPSTGVVDAHCRHHQTENLFVAGGSIFASSVGYANPTLTIVAAALRLGDHLA